MASVTAALRVSELSVIPWVTIRAVSLPPLGAGRTRPARANCHDLATVRTLLGRYPNNVAGGRGGGGPAVAASRRSPTRFTWRRPSPAAAQAGRLDGTARRSADRVRHDRDRPRSGARGPRRLPVHPQPASHACALHGRRRRRLRPQLEAAWRPP